MSEEGLSPNGDCPNSGCWDRPLRGQSLRLILGAALFQEALEPLVAVLAGGVDGAEAARLRKVRVGAVVEHELDELVTRLRVRIGFARRCGCVNRGRLDVLVPRQGVRVG